MNAASAALINEPQTEADWILVCDKHDLIPNSGICALINQKQIALFYSARMDEVFAIGNYDPIGKANVLSRGIIGSLGDAVVVASPLYKQHFNLRTGECMEAPEYNVPVYPISLKDNRLLIQA